MSFFAPYPVTSHALSSSSLPQPVADLVSELKANPTLDGRISISVCSAASSIQRRLDMATVRESDLGSMTSLLSNLVRSCMTGLPVYIRERVRIALPRHPAQAKPLPDYLQVALLVYFAVVPVSMINSEKPKAKTSQKMDAGLYTDIGASDSSGATFRIRNGDSAGDDIGDNGAVASDFSSNRFIPRGQEFSQNLFTQALDGYDIQTVLVMADECAIYNALTSLLYHQRAVGFPSGCPVLGLAYSSSSQGRWLHVVFAWLDETNQASVNVAHDSFETLAGRGTFDATDSNSCKRLAYLLDSVQKSLSKVPGGSYVNRLWRADQVQYSRSIAEASSTRKHIEIENWIANTQSLAECILPGNDEPGASSAPPIEEESAAPSVAASSDWLSPTELLETYLRVGISSKMWLFDRGCVQDTRFLPFVDNYSALFENPNLKPRDVLRVRGMAPLFQSYDDATRFRLPHAWRSGTELPNVSESLKDVRDTFKVAASWRQAQEDSHLGDMEDKMFHKISRFYEDILCAYLRGRDSLDRASAAPGSEICSQFDALHDMIFADAADDGVIISPMVGPTLRLPRNDQADHRLHEYMGMRLRKEMMKSDPHQEFLVAGENVLVELHNTKQGNYEPKITLESAIGEKYVRRHHRWILQDFAGAETRKSVDPKTGFCDSLCVVEIPNAIPVQLLETFAKMSLVVTSKHASMAAPTDEDATHDLSAAAPTTVHSDFIGLPLLVSQYRKKSGPHYFGAMKLRMNLTAAVKYLAALDIWNFAVFGLLTKGATGVVVAAWAVRRTENWPTEVHILERSCCAFNLAKPLGAFHYATFLSWLQLVHAKKLLEAFDSGKRAAFLERLEKGDESVQWAMG